MLDTFASRFPREQRFSRFFPSASRRLSPRLAATLLAVAASTSARADLLSDIGVTALRALNPTITGTGISIAQPESTTYDTGHPGAYDPQWDHDDYEFNPSIITATPFPSILYTGKNGTSSSSFNSSQSNFHALAVATKFYGTATGVAPGVSNIYSYNANYFANYLIFTDTSIPAKVVNQSFTLGSATSNTGLLVAQLYDNYVFNRGSAGPVIVTAAGDGGEVFAPANAYNVITVGAYQGASSVGPINGRVKPDITAPGNPSPGVLTSFTTPLVSGAATLLVQAGANSLGGSGTQTAAQDPRTIKALLLDGALRPSDWTATSSAPLDVRYGAGIVNVLKSYRTLTAGEATAPTSNFTASLGGNHDAVNTGTAYALAGWTLHSITNVNPSSTTDAVDHYLLNLSNDPPMTFSAALTWERPYADVLHDAAPSGINNLDLFLYNAANNTQIALSTSTVDNVEYLTVPILAPGRYDLQVLKHGGDSSNPDWVSTAELYALAWTANLLGDTNFDNKVDSLDLTTLANNWQGTGKLWSQGDFNGDGVVNSLDLTTIANNWQAGAASLTAALASFAPVTSTPVPEPASLLSLGCGASLLLLRRTRRARVL